MANNWFYIVDFTYGKCGFNFATSKEGSQPPSPPNAVCFKKRIQLLGQVTVIWKKCWLCSAHHCVYSSRHWTDHWGPAKIYSDIKMGVTARSLSMEKWNQTDNQPDRQTKTVNHFIFFTTVELLINGEIKSNQKTPQTIN